MLKIVADDFGLHKSVNDGIIFLLKSGKVGGASLMANGEAFEDAVKQCLDNQLVNNIGIHLNLVEQRSLITNQLLPKNHRVFFIKYILGLIDKNSIEKELGAQIDRIINLGIKPAFLNGNQHLHLLPVIMDITIKLAKEYSIPYIRIVNEVVFIPRSWYKYIFFPGWFFRVLQMLFLNFLSFLAIKKIKKAGLKHNDYFIGFINAGKMSQNDINKAEELSKKYPAKIIELGCHPGLEDQYLKIKYRHWGDYNWQKELSLLKND